MISGFEKKPQSDQNYTSNYNMMSCFRLVTVQQNGIPSACALT